MSEILKSIWAKLLFPWALPSALALVATWLFLLPQQGEPLDLLQLLAWDKEGPVFFALTGALAIFLSSISTLLYRLLEGYLWPRCLQEWGIERQRAQKRALEAAVANAQRGTQLGNAVENLAPYPMDDSEIAPTRFGNAIRAFETYGVTRFNMDSQTFWHELVAVSPKYIESEIALARSFVDFFVALFYLSLFFGLACLVFGAIEHFKVSILLLSLPAFLLATFCHWLAIWAIDAWSSPIHALVNLGRVKLADSLGLKLPKTLEEEKKMWGLFTGYTYYANPEDGEALDTYRKAPTEQRAKKHADEEAGNGGNDTDGETP